MARQLGLPEGTVASRLATARRMLAKRLARRGLAVSGGELAAVLTEKSASASVPASVMSPAIKAVTSVAAGQAAAAGVTSRKVAALTEGVLKGMLLTKLKAATAVALLLLALAGLGAGSLLPRMQAADQPKPILRSPGQQTEAQPKNRPAPERFLQVGQRYDFHFAKEGLLLNCEVLEKPLGGWVKVRERQGEKAVTTLINLDHVSSITLSPKD